MYVYMLAYVLPMSGAYESCTKRSLKYIQIKLIYIFFSLYFSYPSITSRCKQSAPHSSNLLHSSAKQDRSALRMEGPIIHLQQPREAMLDFLNDFTIYVTYRYIQQIPHVMKAADSPTTVPEQAGETKFPWSSLKKVTYRSGERIYRFSQG